MATVRVAEAEVKTAEAALAIARSELKRQQQLVERDFVSRQTLERFELALREAASHRDAALAVLAQARNGLGYAKLAADRAGVLTEVSAEPGQVVAVGQPLAVLVEEGPLEVEVYLAEGVRPPEGGKLQLEDRMLPLSLREVAGAADPQSRSWRARYRIEQPSDALSLGTVVQVLLSRGQQGVTLSVPLGALDERSGGPQVWQVLEGKAQPVPVEVLSLESEQARVRALLAEGSRIIALGTHLLTPGMDVREQAQ
jgi:RND family efflux transporter MFP subunit